MRYGIQCHTGAWFLVHHGAEGPELISYSNGADEGVRLLTFDTKEEAELRLSAVVRQVGVVGKYEVISLR